MPTQLTGDDPHDMAQVGGGSGPRVYIVSDVRLHREGLANSLRLQRNLDVVGAGSSEDAPAQIVSSMPDVLLVELSNGEALTLPRRARALLPGLRVVALAVAEAAATVLQCAEAGICGYVPQEGSVEDVVTAVTGALRGEVACPPRITAALFNRLAMLSPGPDDQPWDGALTGREREIAMLVAQGLSNKEIARILRVGPPTIKNHVHNVLRKLNLHRRGEIARLRLGRHAPPNIAAHRPMDSAMG